ncbi:MAG: DegT/DnrJ/EryC1/StrS family aminotransferase [bacterium]|nr:DegT/DnrJ/EryC1/StrS family aminotransferase [bacterium]
MQVPFLDLKSPHIRLKDEILKHVGDALSGAQFIGGENVSGFESEFAAFCGSPHAIAVNSGTDALRFAFIAAGIKPGDVVITVPNTFIATTEAVSQVGAEIAFTDTDEKSHQMDPVRLGETVLKLKKQNRRVRAVVPVHLFGHCADMDPIFEIAKKHDLLVIEDACQAHGAVYKGGKKAGAMATVGCYSFYPGKNLGACGEGGAVVTSDADMDRTVRMLRDHGQSKKYIHEIEGYNGRLDAIQAAILRIKLKHLGEWNAARRKNAKLYDSLFEGVRGVTVVNEPSWSTSVYHLYVIKVADRDTVQKKLGDKGVATALHYPIPLHLQEAYKGLGYKKGDFPVSEKQAEEILSLPMFPELTEEQIRYVADSVKECVA